MLDGLFLFCNLTGLDRQTQTARLGIHVGDADVDLVANTEALMSGADEVICQITEPSGESREYRQAPFGYQAKCLTWLREAYEALSDPDRSRVDAVLNGTGCEQLFT